MKKWQRDMLMLLFGALFSMQSIAANPNFIQSAASHYQFIPSHPDSKKGQILFLPLSSLIVGQDEISVDNTMAKKAEREAEKDIFFQDGKWTFSYDEGKSAVPTADPIDVIKGPQGFVIADGHHDFLLSLHLGAKTIAVRVKEDYSQLGAEEFWEKLRAEELIYLKRNSKSLAKSPPTPAEFKDRPNRYLASLLALKVNAQETKGEIEILGTRAPNRPVWIKLNNSLPFIEFYLADALDRAGVAYEPSWGKKVPPAAIEAARKALLEAAKRPDWKPVPVIESADQADALGKNQEELARYIRRAQIKGCAIAF